jgi:hypothetical protein
MTQNTRTFGRRVGEATDASPDPAPTTLPTPGWPLWPAFLAAMIPAYLLQMVPVLNLLLLFALSPLWIGVLFNAALVAMVLDVRRGAAPKVLLVVPIAVYGLNLAASGAAYLDYRAVDASLKRQNAAHSLPFDPAHMSLVAPLGLADDLVQRYAVPVAYADKPDGDTGRPSSFRVLPKATCETIPKSLDLSMGTGAVSIDGAHVRNACLLRLPAAPDRPPLRVVREDGKAEVPNGERFRTVITAPDGRRAVLTHGRARIPSPIPFPLAGCFTWTAGLECDAKMFTLQPSVGEVAGSVEDREAREVAGVLRLQPRAFTRVETGPRRYALLLDEGQTRRLTTGSESQVAQAQAFGAKAVDEQLARFSRLISGEVASDQSLGVWTVIQNADRLDDQALMAAIERDLGDPSAYDRRGQFGRAAAALTPEAFARIGPRLIVAVAQDEQLQQAEGLLARLGDLGAMAAPTLASLLEREHGTWRISAMLGLCRAGPQARGFADQAAAAARADPRSERLQAGVVALLRMDRRDLAQQLAALPISDNVNAPGRLRHRRWLDNALATVTPASPRSACKVDRRDSEVVDLPWLRG